MSIHEHGTIALTALMRADEHSWAWHHGANITHSALEPYSSVLTSAHEWSWVLMRVHEYSLVILKDQVLDSLINEKCWFLKWLPSSILSISQSWFHQIIKNWIVLKSTLKGLLKNVQDGTSRCFGGRDFNNRKVETILRDTLNDWHENKTRNHFEEIAWTFCVFPWQFIEFFRN